MVKGEVIVTQLIVSCTKSKVEQDPILVEPRIVVKQAFQCREALEVYAFGMLRDRTEAEDVVQDAFLVVMEKYEAFQEGTPMMAWTRSIVRYKVLQALDRRKHRTKVIDRLLTDAVDAALTDDINRRASVHIAEVGRRVGVKRFVFSSSL